MEKINNYVKESWLKKFGMDEVYPDEMLEYFRDVYGFKGTFKELIDELMKKD